MAKQTINIGLSPDDHAGDTLRVAFNKINLNFDELYVTRFRSIEAENSIGTIGDWCFDEDYMYFCIDTNFWKRIALVSWGVQ